MSFILHFVACVTTLSTKVEFIITSFRLMLLICNKHHFQQRAIFEDGLFAVIAILSDL